MPKLPASGAEAWELLVRTCWHGERVAGASESVLRTALALAARNEVQAAFVRAYPDRLPEEADALGRSVSLYRRNVGEACSRLGLASITPVLLEASPDDDFTYSNFDLLVGDGEWDAAVSALRPWVTRISIYPLEKRTKLLLYPPQGPAVHLHRAVGWFDIPALQTEGIRMRARPADGVNCLLPDPVDGLRILLAQAVFQNQSLTLGELLAFRKLDSEAHVREAAGLAMTEGWERGFREASEVAGRTMQQLDRLTPSRLPARLPVASGIVHGLEHALHLARNGHLAAAVREILLRGPLVLAKRRH